MASVLTTAGLASFLVMSLVVGVHLLWLASRTRGLPEALAGMAFVVGGVLGYVPEALVVDFELVPESARAGVLAMANGAIRISAVLVLVFTWRVFRPGDVWGAAPAVVCGIALLAGWIAYPGPWVFAQGPSEWGWSLATAAVRSLAFAWASAESLAWAATARRRAAWGLAEPGASRRFLLWGVAMAGPALMSATPAALRLLPATSDHPAWGIAQSLLGVGAAIAMGLTFFGRTRAGAPVTDSPAPPV